MGRGLTLLLFALCSSLPARASADDRYASAQASRLHVEGAPVVELSADVVCSEAPARCAVELEWTIPASSSPRAAMLLMLAPEVEAVAVDGHALAFELLDESASDFARVAFTLPAASRPVALTLSATLPLVHERYGCSLSGYTLAEARHPLMQREVYDVLLDVEPGVSSDDPPPVRYAADPAVEIEFSRRWTAPRRRQLAFSGVKHPIVHGPLLGAGAQFRGRKARPWLRGGWEFSAVGFLVHSVAVESDLRRFTVVPSTEIGTRSLLIIPPASIGLGLPVRVAPQVRPGARVYGGLNFPFVSIIGGYDVFPPLAGRPTEHLGRIGLQVSL